MAEPQSVISLGAGVQSTVLLLMAEQGLILPRPIAAVFADTGWEPRQVYQHLEWLELQTTIPVYRVSNRRDLYRATWDGVGPRFPHLYKHPGIRYRPGWQGPDVRPAMHKALQDHPNPPEGAGTDWAATPLTIRANCSAVDRDHNG